MPELSVIMPVYNCEKYVSQAIQSILDQTFTDFELLISDDGSRDKSREIIDQFASKDARIRVSHNQVNEGKTDTVNRLFKLCRGRFITIHDSDDWSSAIRFEKQVGFMNANQDYVVCGANFITVNESGSEFMRSALNLTFDEIMEDAKHKSQIHGPTAVFRRETCLSLGSLYRPYFRDNFEDVDFIYRLLTLGRGQNIPDHLYFYRILPQSLCRREYTVRNRHLYHVAYYLMEQRLKSQKDDLEVGKIEDVDRYLNEITKEYRIDSSKIHREAAAYYLYWKFYWKSLSAAFKAVWLNPTKPINLRTLFYCLRKSTLR